MKRSKPPALATWLLEHVRFSTTDGVIAGDLLEEFNRRRSAAWYWRQVLVAIVVGCASEVRRHWMLALRAILITWSANYTAMLLGRRIGVAFSRYGLPGGMSGLLGGWVIPLLGATASGLIVTLLHRKHRNAMLFTSAGALLGWSFIAIMLLKKWRVQPSFVQIVSVVIVYYLVALTAFAIGGFLPTSAARAITPVSGHGSPEH